MNITFEHAAFGGLSSLTSDVQRVILGVIAELRRDPRLVDAIEFEPNHFLLPISAYVVLYDIEDEGEIVIITVGPRGLALGQGGSFGV